MHDWCNYELCRAYVLNSLKDGPANYRLLCREGAMPASSNVLGLS